MTRLRYGAAALLLLPACAAGMDLQGTDIISDPDMISEMKKVDESNLENAMARGEAEAIASAANISAIMYSARRQVSATLGEIRPILAETTRPEPGSIEDSSEQLRVSAPMLRKRSEEFIAAAAEASLRLQEFEAEKLLTRRAVYPRSDRKRDLKDAGSFLQAAREKTGAVRLMGKRDALIGSADAFLGELRGARAAISRIEARLKDGSRTSRNKKIVFERIEPRVKELEADYDDLVTERGLLNASLLLMEHDDAAFDMGL